MSAPRWGSRVREHLELLGAGGVAHALERLGLDLANALARDTELLADFFQGPVVAVGQPVAQAQDARLARLERLQQRQRARAPLAAERRLERRLRLPVLDEVAD